MKKIVITGGSKGIGQAIARKFAAQNYTVVISGRNEADMITLQQSLQKEGKTLYFLKADMSVKEDVKAFGKFALEAEGELDVLVNNAGVFLPGGIADEPDGQLESTLALNVQANYYLTRELLPAFKQRQQGHIFTICSTASIVPYTSGASYGISKYALLGFSRILREELKPFRVKVTSILPGATYTGSWDGAGISPERFMKPEDIADIIWQATRLSPSAVVEEILLRPVEGDI